MSWRHLVFILVSGALHSSCGAREQAGSDGGATFVLDAAVEADATRPGLASRSSNPTCLPPRQVPASGLEGLPARLSDTGCFDGTDPRRPLPALLPYQVNMPLWADGATKERWLALPDGAQIQIKPDGDLELPPGAVTIKTFRLGDRATETRFFVRLLSGDWFGYTYEWNEAQTDATLLDEGNHLRPAGAGNWYFPSRAECKQCHTEAAGFSLGLEIAQLNSEFTASAGQANQLTTWEQIGLFGSPLSLPVDRLPAFPRPEDESAPAERRARAYLHANCAHCHRPEIDSSGSVNLRFTTPLPATMGCDELPRKGTHGFGADVRILAPGKPERSMLVLRMRLLEAGRMPEVASFVVDEVGTGLIEAWIRSLSGCL